MSENAKKWNSDGLAGDYVLLRKELEEKERALTAANERADRKCWDAAAFYQRLHILETERNILRSSLEKAKGEMREMVRVDVLLRWMDRVEEPFDKWNFESEGNEDNWQELYDILALRASRSKGEGR